LFPITSLLPPLPRLKIVDVGAMDLGAAELPYAALLKATPCDLIGFEPVGAEFDKLKRQTKTNELFLPYFIGDGSTRTFHECNFPMTSSLLEPNTALLAKFQNLEEVVRVVKTSTVETTRLDDIPEVRGTDLLKLDIQGAELLALRGGEKLLADVLVIHTEVEFVELYKGQPLFAEIDAFLRGRGFQFHQLNWTGRTFKPLVANNDLNAPMSQWLWGDALYVRDFMTFDTLAPAALIKLACILHENYRSFDLAAVALDAYDRQTGALIHKAYIERLTKPQS
jgi:FkbM family methyltransferase